MTQLDKLAVTPEEAARLLSIGRSALYELMASGELRSFKIGRSRRVAVSAIEEFVRRQTEINEEES